MLRLSCINPGAPANLTCAFQVSKIRIEPSVLYKFDYCGYAAYLMHLGKFKDRGVILKCTF